jgi:hypothetical protein
MSNVIQAPSVEIAVSPKLIAAGKALVTLDQTYQKNRGEKLNTMIEAIRDDLKRGCTAKAITVALKATGVDGGAVSNSITIASPKTDAAKAALQQAEAHNAKLPKDARTGTKLGFHDLVKIAKGEETPETILTKRAETKAAKAPSTTSQSPAPSSTSQSVQLPKLTKAELHKRIYALIKLADDDGISLEDVEEAFESEMADYVEAKNNPHKA